MIKRVIEISSAGTHLSVKLGQLIVRIPEEGRTHSTGSGQEETQRRRLREVGRIPCEDIGVLLVWHTGVSYTHAVFIELLKYGAAIILCDGRYLPAGMMLPLESNAVQTERFRTQIEAKEPVKKQLWRQLVRAKIAHQADVVKEDEKTSKFLRGLRDKVRSGDPDNIEAQASKRYWAAFMPKGRDTRIQRHKDTGEPSTSSDKSGSAAATPSKVERDSSVASLPQNDEGRFEFWKEEISAAELSAQKMCSLLQFLSGFSIIRNKWEQKQEVKCPIINQ